MRPRSGLAPSHSVPRGSRSLILKICCALSIVVAVQSARAAEYTIQIGAFSKPSSAYADSARKYGEVNTSQNSKGITVFTVGRYPSPSSANAELDRLRAAYPDAFVRRMPSSSQREVAASAPARVNGAVKPKPQPVPIDAGSTTAKWPKPPPKARAAQAMLADAAVTPEKPKKKRKLISSSTDDTNIWDSLTEAERKRVVYLDGVLHLKQGARFVPLAEYRRNQ